VISGSLLGRNTTYGGLRLFAGQFGSVEIKQFSIKKKLIKNPLEIICHTCALMSYWSGLYTELDQEQLVEGANTMLRVAKEVLATQTARQVNHLLLKDAECSDHEEHNPV